MNVCAVSDRKRAIDLGEPPAKKKPSAGIDDINGGINPWTNRAYTEQFYHILEKRKSLPVVKFKQVRRVRCVRRLRRVRQDRAHTHVLTHARTHAHMHAFTHVQQILEQMEKSQTVVLVGETGSGKVRCLSVARLRRVVGAQTD